MSVSRTVSDRLVSDNGWLRNRTMSLINTSPNTVGQLYRYHLKASERFPLHAIASMTISSPILTQYTNVTETPLEQSPHLCYDK